MKYLLRLFLLVIFFQPLYSIYYVDSLDQIIYDKVEDLSHSPYAVDDIVKKIKSNIKQQVSLQEIDEFLNHEHSVAFFFCDTIQSKLNKSLPEETEDDYLCGHIEESIDEHALEVQQSLKDLKFVLGAKLYLYYLECCKQKMLYKAVKNYDALNFWQNEKFSETQSWYQKNILRWLSRASYQDRIENNIILLQDVTQQTNSFLGLVKHNQDLLLQATTQQEFEQRLIIVVKLQDEFLHVPDCDYENYDIGVIVKKAIDQVYRFSLHLSSQYAQCQLPSHVERNWHTYTLSAAGMCVCAFIYAKYGDDIMKGTMHFYGDHIEGPLKRNIEYFSGVAKPTQFNVDATEKSLQIAEEAGGARPFPHDKNVPLHVATAVSIRELTNGESDKILQEVDDFRTIAKEVATTVVPIVNRVGPAVDGILPMVNDGIESYNQVVKTFFEENQNFTLLNPFPNLSSFDAAGKVAKFHWNIWLGKPFADIHNIINNPNKPFVSNYIPLVLPNSLQSSTITSRIEQAIPFTRKYPENYENMSQKDRDDIILSSIAKNPVDAPDAARRELLRKEIEAENHINKVLKDIHMLLGLTALIPVVTVIYSSFFASKNLYNTVAYQPIRTFVRHLEVHLNESFYQPTSFDREGHLYFLTEQLKLNTGVLTVSEQKLMGADIADLQSQKLDYVQKFNVVQRMYRTYPCLVPATV